MGRVVRVVELDLCVDIGKRERHLNPKIGLDWMGLGQQKEVMTPGKNEKRYLAGALNARTREVHWVEARKKDAWLFMDLLKKSAPVLSGLQPD